MKSRTFTLAIAIAALAMVFLYAGSAYATYWYNCKSLVITSPQNGDRFETHDRVQVRWTAGYQGDFPIPGDPIEFRIRLTAPCGCLLYEYRGSYTELSTNDPPVGCDYRAIGKHSFLVPGFITEKYPNSTLPVESQRTPSYYDPWMYRSVTVDIKMIYDPLPEPYSVSGSISQNSIGTYLREPYPNPFNPQTSIQFGLEEAAKVSLEIFDVNGRLVKTLYHNHDLPAGKYQEIWTGLNNDGAGVASGIYFLRLMTSSGYSKAHRLILLK